MANRLKMAVQHTIITLVRQGWSYRRIATELGVDRDTVSRYARSATPSESRADPPSHPPEAAAVSGSNAAISITGFVGDGSVPSRGGEGSPSPTSDSNAAISITGSGGATASASETTSASATDAAVTTSGPAPAGRRSQCEPYRAVIVECLERGLSAQRIWQDLRDEQGFADSYQTVQRFVRALRRSQPLPFRRMECAPGEEAQVDFGTGAWLIDPLDPSQRAGTHGVTTQPQSSISLNPSPPAGKTRRRRTHVFRMVLSCSRKAYSEAVTHQSAEHFIRCLENAFWHFGGVPKTLVVDNLKAAVLKADWFDPELNPKLEAFCRHYGTVVLPTRPAMPRHKGKIERGIGYVKDNALKGRTFPSLQEQNRFLAEWESSVADTRIHGTTRRQVSPVFEQVEKPALLPLPAGRFPSFAEAQRMVNRDGHVEVAKAYYSVPPEFLGRAVWCRWDGRLVRIFDQKLQQIALHAQHEPGRFATQGAHIAPEKRGGIERGAAWWLEKAAKIGPQADGWAQTVLEQRGVHSVRVLMGLASLTRKHSSSAIETACKTARSHGAYRLRDVSQLLKRQAPPQDQFEFIAEHPLIRPLADYDERVQEAFEELHA